MPVSDSMWWDDPFALRMVSFLTCCELLRFTTSNKYITALQLQQGLLTIHVTEYTAMERQRFINWARQCLLLLKLNISYTNISDEMVQEVARHYTHLLSLNAKACPFVTDQAVRIVARHCPSLIKIRLGYEQPFGRYRPHITDAAVESIAHYCTRLIQIDLDNTLVTDSAAQALAHSCQRLRHVSVCNTRVTVVGAMALAQLCSRASAMEDTHVETSAIRIAHPEYNLRIIGLSCANHAEMIQARDALNHTLLRQRFPNIRIVGPWLDTQTLEWVCPLNITEATPPGGVIEAVLQRAPWQ